ncbi:MAG: nitrite reductase small subunit NirD [Planctomycetes bacterium]|nr:nitrite reductase small subunit NirD [Planctomycetota bacterium]
MQSNQETVVVIGNGMVGHRFVEKLVEFDTLKQYKIVTFCEEPRAAYDRVGLTSFFAHRDAEQLMIARLDWYKDQGVELHLGDRACKVDRKKRVVHSDAGEKIPFRKIVLATGSYPFVPPIEGIKHRGVFVYRTIEDLERIIKFGRSSKRCAVIGGGLLGLEAAKAAYDLGLETHVIEFASRLMPRQIDDDGSRILVQKIEKLGVHVHLNKGTKEILGDGRVEQMVFTDGEVLDVDMIIVSCGIRPRDDLARECGLEVGERGGVTINDSLQTSDADIFAVGEVAQHSGMVYGLVAPGYEMAEILAMNLTGSEAQFTGADLSTKLKLMGIDVASFGEYELPANQATPLVYEDPIGGVYKKLFFTPSGKRILGGILVGDASDYGTLSILTKSGDELPCQAGDLLGGSSAGATALLGGAAAMPDDAQICSCNNVTKEDICKAIAKQDINTLTELKVCTKAGTGCGGCLSMVNDLFKAQMKEAGVEVTNHLCEHFAYTRQELFTVAKVKQIRTFEEMLKFLGHGNGCENCKPIIASILASLWNETIVEPEHQMLQDTNDRFLANVQRGGLYSVVPRIPGGEITPDKLLVIGNVAKKYGLYTKITGGQRIDLFGAQQHQLPDIWEELIEAGFESGHAYGKSVRTVKSCVGSSWCRYGVQDSVRFAIEIEKRYRGVRAPHKIKFAVSGCMRECAEAQCKDVGLIATESGYNLYVGGNGGAKPRHADLFATDVDRQTAIKYIDRFLMYYIFTADKLTRTATWLEQIEGGLEHVKEVVIDDKLGLCNELEGRMQHLVDTYQCEWKAVVDDPEKRKLFRQFINTEETEPSIEFVAERDQQRPAYWPKEGVRLDQIKLPNGSLLGETDNSDAARKARRAQEEWVPVGTVNDFPRDGGAAIKYGDVQIAVFNFATRGEWYACQNMCPHKNAFVLSRGILGDVGTVPKVACPLHKKPFSLETGESLSGEDLSVKVFPVKIDGDKVLVKLPPQPQLDSLLATELHQICANDSRGCTSCSSTEEARELSGSAT